jgi:hypothetical protein
VKNSPADEPMPLLPQEEDEPTIAANVGSSVLGSADVDDEEVEPQRHRHPDNDGETVEE